MDSTTFCSSMLRDLSTIPMSESVRVRAEDGVRKSAAIIELLAGMLGDSAAREEKAAQVS